MNLCTSSRFASAVVALSLLATPFTALAASPQTLINQALLKINERLPLRSEAVINIDIRQRAVTKAGQSGSGSIQLSLSERSLKKVDDRQDNEGRFSVDSIKLSTGVTAGLPISLNELNGSNPIAIQWKSVDKQLSLRLEKFPATFATLLKQQGLDLTPYIGQWITIDGEAGTALSEANPSTINPVLPTDTKGLTAIMKMRPLFLVTRVEKKTKLTDNQIASRVRLRLNPAVISQLQREELSRVVRSGAFWRTEVKAINKSYADLRTLLAGMNFVAEVNETTGKLNRIEVGGVTRQPQTTCTYNAKLRKSVCPTTSITTITFSGGVSFFDDAGKPVEAPVDAMSFTQILDQYKAKLDPTETSSTVSL